MVKIIKEKKYICPKTDCFFTATPCTVTESYYIDNGKLMYSKYSKTTNGTAVCHENYECDKQIKIEF
jgi:hypothetical protein